MDHDRQAQFKAAPAPVCFKLGVWHVSSRICITSPYTVQASPEAPFCKGTTPCRWATRIFGKWRSSPPEGNHIVTCAVCLGLRVAHLT
jgi:hypothetical protein